MSNAYLDEVGSSSPKQIGAPDRLGLEHRIRRFKLRESLVAKYSWSIPTDELIETCVKLGSTVGAGTGYIESLIRKAGGDILATDTNVWPDTAYSHGRPHMSIEAMGAAEAATRHADRTLFLSWPPLEDPMGSDAISAYLDAGGKRVIYIGESIGGCTGDAKMFDLLYKNFEMVKEIYIPQWEGIRDFAAVYERPEESKLAKLLGR